MGDHRKQVIGRLFVIDGELTAVKDLALQPYNIVTSFVRLPQKALCSFLHIMHYTPQYLETLWCIKSLEIPFKLLFLLKDCDHGEEITSNLLWRDL